METLLIVECLHGSHAVSIHKSEVLFSLISSASYPWSSFLSLIDSRRLCLSVFLYLEPFLTLSTALLVPILLSPATLFVEVYLEYPYPQFVLWNSGATSLQEGYSSSVVSGLDIYLESLLEVRLLVVHMV